MQARENFDHFLAARPERFDMLGDLLEQYGLNLRSRLAQAAASD